jgi:Fur family ferric uptake transcriptional regulator
MTAHYPNRYRYRDRDRFTLQSDIDSDTDFDFDEALANTNKSNMINGGRRDWRFPSTKQSKNVHFFELWDHCGNFLFLNFQYQELLSIKKTNHIGLGRAVKQATRNTKQRAVILEYLRSVTCHPTAEEVHRAVIATLPRISLGTVYRNLGKLVETGRIQIIENAGGQRRYDGNPASHVHATCTACGRVTDVKVQRGILENLKDITSMAGDGFEVTDCRLQLVGKCPECSSSN